MAMREKVRATAYTCDGCGKRTVCEAGEQPEGYHGTVYEIDESGGSAEVQWYACRPEQIRAAVLAALERSREQT